jgi:hypothetical protein
MAPKLFTVICNPGLANTYFIFYWFSEGIQQGLELRYGHIDSSFQLRKTVSDMMHQQLSKEMTVSSHLLFKIQWLDAVNLQC